MKSEKGWNWKDAGKARYQARGRKMEVGIPLELLGLDKSREIDLSFHWADNIQRQDDIVEFSINGDSAPNRRFNYLFKGRF